MKVLITNGSRQGTWYHGRAGEVLDVTEITDQYYNVPNQGGLGNYGVRKEDGELLYTEKEYNDMENHYMKELEESRNHKKVKLPRKVAEGLDYARARWRGIAIMDAIMHKKDGYGLEFVYAWVYKNPGSLQEGDRKDMIMAALVNGYEIEESPEERLENDLIKIISKWLNIERKVSEEEDNRVLAQWIIKRIKEGNEDASH